MNKKLLLLIAFISMNVISFAQTWEWKGETPSSGNAYALCAELNGVKKFLNDNNGFDGDPKVFWTVKGSFPGNTNGSSSYTLTSGGGKTFSIYNDWGAKISTSQTKSGDDIKLASNQQGNYYSICRYKKISTIVGNRNVVVNDWKLSVGSDPTYCWLFISQTQVDLRNQYINTYNQAKTLSETFAAGAVPQVLSDALTNCDSATKDNAGERIKTLEDAMKAAAQKFYAKVIATANDAAMGSVSMTYNGDNAGASITYNTFVYEGTSPTVPSFEITLEATPNDDYYFVKWTNGTEELTEANHKITVEGTTELNEITWTAVFAAKPTYLSTITANATTGGKVSVSVDGTATEFGNTATANYSSKSIDAPKHLYTLSAQAEDGYVFVGWAKSENATNYSSTEASYTAEITASVETASDTYYAIFHPYYYSSVTVNAEIGGKVYVSKTNSAPTDASAYEKTSSTDQKSASKDAPNHTYYIFAQAEEGYEFVGLKYQTNKNSITVKAESKDEANPTSATLTAVFAKIQQSATVAPGKYYIKNVSTGKYMKCASKDLQYDTEVDGEKDLFELVLDEDNKYFIKNTNNRYVTWSGEALNVNDQSNTTNVLFVRGNASYRFNDKGDGIYEIYYDGTGNYYLNVEGNTLSRNNVTWPSSPTVSMQWQLIPAETANLKINASSHGTFCAPFNITLPDGVEAYKVSEITAESAKLAKLNLDNQVLPAGTPVIVKFADDELPINKDYNGLNTKVETSVSKDNLVGFYANGATAPVGSYVLQNQGSGMKFYIVGSQAINMPKNRCYMSTGAANNVKVLNIIFEEETAVSDIQNTPTAVEYYSINGTKLSAPKSGINIVKTADGSVKKIYVK